MYGGHGIQEVSGSIPLISTRKVPKSSDFGTFSLLLRRKSSSFNQTVAGVQLPDRNLTGIEKIFILAYKKPQKIALPHPGAPEIGREGSAGSYPYPRAQQGSGWSANPHPRPAAG